MSEYSMTPMHLLGQIGHIHCAHLEPGNSWAILERNGSLGVAKVGASDDETLNFEDLLEFCQFVTGVSDGILWYDEPKKLAEELHDLPVLRFIGTNAIETFSEYLESLDVIPPRDNQVTLDLKMNGDDSRLIVKGTERACRKIRDLITQVASRDSETPQQSI